MAPTEKRKNHSEQQVKEGSNSIVSSTDKIVFVTHYSRDMDRFRSLYTVAKENNRKFVVSTKTAHLLSKLVDDKRLDLPDPAEDETIRVYYKRKKSGEHQEKDYYAWERPFLEKKVTYEDIHQNQSEIVMDLNFYQFAELIDIEPDAGSHFVHSMSEPFSEEDIEDQVMHNWLDYFKLKFHQIHASGHISKKQLIDMLVIIGAKQVFPVHTENQRLFQNYCYKCQMVKPEKVFKL